MGEGTLGDTLRIWNEDYFAELGLTVHLELSEEAVRHGGASKAVRKHSLLYSSREERERKREERKFVLVVTPLDGRFVQHSGEASELPASDEALEMPVQADVSTFTTELPGSEGSKSVELPTTRVDAESTVGQQVFELPAELPASFGGTAVHDKKSIRRKAVREQTSRESGVEGS